MGLGCVGKTGWADNDGRAGTRVTALSSEQMGPFRSLIALARFLGPKGTNGREGPGPTKQTRKTREWSGQPGNLEQKEKRTERYVHLGCRERGGRGESSLLLGAWACESVAKGERDERLGWVELFTAGQEGVGTGEWGCGEGVAVRILGGREKRKNTALPLPPQPKACVPSPIHLFNVRTPSLPSPFQFLHSLAL